MQWFSFEIVWRDALLGAILPTRTRPDGVVVPGLNALNLQPFWTQFAAAAPLTLRVGLRATVWLLTWLPGPLGFGWRVLAQLPPGERDAYVQHLTTCDVWLVRQLADTLKIVASFAYFQDAGVRARIDGDRA